MSKKAAKAVLHSRWFAIVSIVLGIGTLISFLTCCLLEHVGVFVADSTWVVVWLFATLTATSVFGLIMWTAIVVESCCRLEE